MHPKTIGIIAHTGKAGVGDLVNAIAEEFSSFSIRPSGCSRRRRHNSAGSWAARGSHKADLRHQRGLARFPDHREFRDLSRGSGMPR